MADTTASAGLFLSHRDRQQGPSSLSLRTLASQRSTRTGKTRPPSASAAPRAAHDHIWQSIQNVKERRAYRESREQRIDRTRHEVERALESRESMVIEIARKTREREEEEALLAGGRVSQQTAKAGAKPSATGGRSRPLSAVVPPKVLRTSQSTSSFLPPVGASANAGLKRLNMMGARPQSGMLLPPRQLRPPSRYMKRS